MVSLECTGVDFAGFSFLTTAGATFSLLDDFCFDFAPSVAFDFAIIR